MQHLQWNLFVRPRRLLSDNPRRLFAHPRSLVPPSIRKRLHIMLFLQSGQYSRAYRTSICTYLNKTLAQPRNWELNWKPRLKIGRSEGLSLGRKGSNTLPPFNRCSRPIKWVNPFENYHSLASCNLTVPYNRFPAGRGRRRRSLWMKSRRLNFPILRSSYLTLWPRSAHGSTARFRVDPWRLGSEGQ